jgi:GNAT superfamily N-acetyltransferase
MSLDLRAAASLSLADRTELFNAAYEGYLVPFHLEEQQLSAMDSWFDIDLDASVIAFQDGTPVGLANLGVRGEDGWVGGVGVVTAARRSGIGEKLMEALHENGRRLGLRRVWLEVIVENTGAFALYKKLGYRTVQDVEVWTLPTEEGELEGQEVSAAEAQALLPDRHEPWQRADGTLANNDDIRGLVTDGGAAVFALRSNVQLLQYAGQAEPIVRALRTFGNFFVLNLPADDPLAAVLRELGATVVVRQHEMVLTL